MEKIRQLALLLESGIDDYDDAAQTLQEERLKYLRLSMTDGFGAEGDSSKTSWLSHLQTLEANAQARLAALRQAVVNAAVEIQRDMPQPATPVPDEPEEVDEPSERDKV